MPNNSDSVVADDNLKNKLKESLSDWREFVVILYSVFIWQKSYYPFIISSVVATVFAAIWYSDVSVLTSVSILGIISCLTDYLIPVVSNNLFDPTKWNESKESVFDRTCAQLAICWQTIIIAYNEFTKMKTLKPKSYYVSVLSALLLLSWIGNIVNNLFLTFLLVKFVALFPGLKYNGYIDQLVSSLTHYVSNAVKKSK